MPKQEYTPLHFAKNFAVKDLKAILNEVVRFFPPAPMIKDEVIRNINSLDADRIFEMVEDNFFLKPGYSGLYPVLERYLIKMEEAGADRIFFDQDENSSSGWRNIFQMIAVSEKWRMNKQVYEFDPDFSAELCKTEKLRIYPSLFQRLPYSTFYIDLSKDPKFNMFDGAFVSVHVINNEEMTIYIDRVLSEIFFGGMDIYRKHSAKYENGVAYYNYEKDTRVQNGTLEVPEDIRKRINHPSLQDNGQINNESYPDLMSFILQALTYMVSREPEISENAATKKTYRPAVSVKDKFSEIQKWDVGVRYGKRIRLFQEENKNSEEGQDLVEQDHEEQGEQKGKSKRKPPRPHSRCAHWQRYHIGKGRTELEIKWVEPTFVGARDCMTVEKHRITK